MFIIMETDRLKRYNEKLELINERKSEIKDWSDDFFEDKKSMLASYKAFQEVVESATDILAMMLKDEGLIPADDYTNIERAEGKKLIDKKMAEQLKEANGLRNRVIHEYNGLNNQIAHESMIEFLPVFENFVEKVEQWLQKK